MNKLSKFCFAHPFPTRIRRSNSRNTTSERQPPSAATHQIPNLDPSRLSMDSEKSFGERGPQSAAHRRARTGRAPRLRKRAGRRLRPAPTRGRAAAAATRGPRRLRPHHGVRGGEGAAAAPQDLAAVVPQECARQQAQPPAHHRHAGGLRRLYAQAQRRQFAAGIFWVFFWFARRARIRAILSPCLFWFEFLRCRVPSRTFGDDRLGSAGFFVGEIALM